MKRSPLRRRIPLKRGQRRSANTAETLRRFRINPIGPRTKKWLRIREEVVDPELKAHHIDYCEFAGHLPGRCWGQLERAHSKKRRNCVTDEDWAEVALACHAHHQMLDEQMTHQEMLEAVRAAIARRPLN